MLGDENQLRQVLANLLRNAVVHTPAGTPVEVAVRRNGREVELEVRDHGPGLPTDSPDDLFERFWRSRAERPRAQGRGAGLGLAIVAGIVAAHHGRVTRRERPGRGSEVRGQPAAGGLIARAQHRRQIDVQCWSVYWNCQPSRPAIARRNPMSGPSSARAVRVSWANSKRQSVSRISPRALPISTLAEIVLPG